MDTEPAASPRLPDDTKALRAMVMALMTERDTLRYSAQFKARVALEALRGELTAAQLAAKHGIHQTMVGACAHSDDGSHRFRSKPATCSDRSQPGIPMIPAG